MNIGVNAEQSVVKNWPRLLDHLSKTRPQMCVTYGTGAADDMRGAGVQRVIVRLYPDGGGVNSGLTPDGWMRKYDNVRRRGHFAEYDNEDGLQTKNLMELIPKAMKEGFSMTVPGLACANLAYTDLPAYREILDWMTDTWPDRLRFSFHNYYAASPIIGTGRVQSALDGMRWNPAMGSPDHPWYTVGREVEMMVRYQTLRGKPMPGMDCTEFGIGNVTAPNFGAIPRHSWGTANGKPTYYDVNYGWLADSEYLKLGWPKWSPIRSYAKQIIWCDQTFFAPFNIPLAVYCYGADPSRPPGSEQDWKPFNVEEDDPSDYRQEMEIYAAGAQPEESKMVWIPTLIAPTEDYVNLRNRPTTKGSILGVLKSPTKTEVDGGNFTYDTIQPYGAGYWMPVRFRIDGSEIYGPTLYVFSGASKFITT